VEMVRHAANCDHLVGFVLDDTCYVSIEFFFPLGLDQADPVLHRKDKMNIKLSVGVCHFLSFSKRAYKAIPYKLSLKTETLTLLHRSRMFVKTPIP